MAREGYPVVMDGSRLGRVTSGAPSPTLGVPIAMAYVPPDRAAPGTDLEVEIRGRGVGVRVVETPFVRSKRPGETGD